MAKIPRISPGSTQMDTRSTIPTKPYQAQQDFVDSLGAGLQEFGGAVEKVGGEQYKRLFEARAFTEMAQAEADEIKWQADELLKADQATDSMGRPYQGTVDEYGFEQRAKERETTVKGFFSDKQTEARFMAERQKSVIRTGVQLQKKFTDNMIDAGTASINEAVVVATQAYAAAPDSVQVVNGVPQMSKALYADKIKGLYKEAVSKGFMKQTVASKLEATALKTAKRDSFLFDLNNNFKDVETNLEQNSYGLDILQLKNAKSLYNTEKGRIQNGHQTELDQLFYDNALTDDVIDKYVAEKWIEPKDGTAYKNSLQKGVAVESDPFMYNSMLERANEIKNFGGWWKNTAEKQEAFKQGTQMRIEILAKVGKGLSKEDAGKMLGVVDKAFERHTPYSRGLMQLTDFANKNYTAKQKDIVKQNIYKRYMELAKEGVDPVDALKQAKDIYAKYDINDLEYTAKETGLPIQRIVDTLEKQGKR